MATYSSIGKTPWSRGLEEGETMIHGVEKSQKRLSVHVYLKDGFYSSNSIIITTNAIYNAK